MRDVIFINSHPIQYFAPMYKYMNEQGINTQAWYGSDESIKGGRDLEFGVDVKWDISLLDGYKYIFFKNHSWKPSHTNGFFGLINLGMIKELYRIPKSVIIIHGWHYFTHLLILLIGRIKGHTICLRSEIPHNQEVLKKGWKQTIKWLGLKIIVFPRIDFFLYIGTQNRLFYKSLGVANTRLLFCPYSVDNNRFRDEYRKLLANKNSLRNKLKIPASDKIILYSGKYIDKKRPLDVLSAFHLLNKPDCWLIMVGEGELRAKMEEFVSQHQLKQVIFTGFVNQSQISTYYAINDVFVMCSTAGETWGLSVNEAMNFNVPILVSDLSGCAIDLVEEGNNGYIFKTGDVSDLTLKLRHILYDSKLSCTPFSSHIINKYSYDSVVKTITYLLCSLYSNK